MNPKTVTSINSWHRLRRLVYGVYEKNFDFEKAMQVVKSTKMPPTFRDGLKAELIFYEKHRQDRKLEALLDVGVKADFTGLENGKLVNYDVTSNIEFKDINKYVEVIQKRRKEYQVAWVNVKSEEVVLFPLKFPICNTCNRFSHHILYNRPSVSDTVNSWGQTDDQVILRYCPFCDNDEEIQEFNYYIPLLSIGTQELESEKDVDDTRMYSRSQIQEIIQKDAIKMARFFEDLSGLLISGVAENYYHITNPHDANGYYEGKLYWRHPLAKDLGTALSIAYESIG